MSKGRTCPSVEAPPVLSVVEGVAAGGRAGADYPRAAFPWASVQELSEALDQAREPKATR